jgi:hypothetical protein
MAIPGCTAHVVRVALTYLRPLPTLIVFGLQRHSMMRFSVLVTRRAGKEKIHLNAQTFVGKIIDHVQGAKAAPVAFGNKHN